MRFVSVLSKKTSYAIEGSPLSLSKTVRPSKDEVVEAFKGLDVVIGNDYSFFLPTYNAYESNGFPKDPVAFCPINDLSLKDREKTFLVEGRAPQGESMSFALVNEEFEKNLGEKALGKILTVRSKTKVSEGDITDDVELSYNFRVLGVVHEFPFLNVPRVYYSYPALSKEMARTKLPNISKERGESVSVASFVSEASPSSEYSGYSYLTFFKEKDMWRIENSGMEVGGLSLTSDPLAINQSFMALTDAFAGCLIPFIIIEVLGIAFILGSLSYSSFMERRKQAAILTALGASKNDRSFIYEGEGFLNAFLSSIIALVLSFPLERLLSSYLKSQTGMSSLIDIPYFSYLGYPMLPIAVTIVFALIVALFSSALPLTFVAKRPLASKQNHEPIEKTLFFVLKKDREDLYPVLDKRVDKMVEMGLENEVVPLLKKYGEDAPAFRAIGVKEFIPYVEGKQDIETVIENIKLDTRHYVKRQDTFFRHQFPAIEVSSLEDILKVIENERDN